MATPIAAKPAVAIPPPGATFRFVARQPILTRDEQIYGYELLFRDGAENYFSGLDPEQAARSTLDSSLLLGWDVLCHGHLAFLNCTREFLLADYVSLLPVKQTVIEILETITPDTEVIAACQRLQQAGYRIALDDFVANDPREPLVPFADIIKVDLRAATPDEQAAIVRRLGSRHRMLAEKVETREEFQATRDLGFEYFQGYFFCRPEVMVAQDIPSNRLNYLLMLKTVSQPELDIEELEKLIKSDAAVCYRLLRYLNSAAFAFTSEIHSVRHAISMLGQREVRRWVQLVAMISAGQQKSGEVILTALVRARFCELLSPKVQHGESDLFLMGLMSLMDTVLQMPMTQLLEKLPLDLPIKNVLLGEPSYLRTIYRLMLAQESGEWPAAIELSKLLNLDKDEVAGFHWQALRWAREVCTG